MRKPKSDQSILEYFNDHENVLTKDMKILIFTQPFLTFDFSHAVYGGLIKLLIGCEDQNASYRSKPLICLQEYEENGEFRYYFRIDGSNICRQTLIIVQEQDVEKFVGKFPENFKVVSEQEVIKSISEYSVYLANNSLKGKNLGECKNVAINGQRDVIINDREYINLDNLIMHCEKTINQFKNGLPSGKWNGVSTEQCFIRYIRCSRNRRKKCDRDLVVDGYEPVLIFQCYSTDNNESNNAFIYVKLVNGKDYAYVIINPNFINAHQYQIIIGPLNEFNGRIEINDAITIFDKIRKILEMDHNSLSNCENVTVRKIKSEIESESVSRFLKKYPANKRRRG